MLVEQESGGGAGGAVTHAIVGGRPALFLEVTPHFAGCLRLLDGPTGAVSDECIGASARELYTWQGPRRYQGLIFDVAFISIDVSKSEFLLSACLQSTPASVRLCTHRQRSPVVSIMARACGSALKGLWQRA